jgi:magnesium chelatase subunit H
MRKRTSETDGITAGAVPVRVVILTLDKHISGAVDRAREQLRAELPGLDLRLHAGTNFSDPKAAAACCADIAQGDIVFANMLFIDEHIRAVLPALQARRDSCDAMVCAMSAGEVMRQTRMGGFRMDGTSKGPLALLKKLRGKPNGASKDGGSGQMAMLRTLPKLLRFIPGKAQELRTYFLTLSYWLSGSSENIADLIRLLVNRYADGPRASLRGTLDAKPPREYLENGLYHPRLAERMTDSVAALPRPEKIKVKGTVGLLLMRSYVLSGDSGHYDAVIEKLEAHGLRVIPAFASGLDSRPAIEKYFFDGKNVVVDAVVSLTGFSLVGGPAFNDAKAAEEMLARLDVPYVAAQPLEFQSIDQWKASANGLTPLESTIMIAIPELDGATGPIVFGGRPGDASDKATQMTGIDERIEMLAKRVERLIANRKTPKNERNVAIVLFNFPPNGGATGTAAYLSVFESLHNTLGAMKREGYDVEVPATVDELRARVLEGNASRFGTDANVVARIHVDDHVRAEAHLAEIEKQWGPAPGKHQTDGSSILILGAQLGRVLIGIQPAFGYEGDPMRLLFESGFAPTHAFAAFYRYLREGYAAHSVLHFGTHGALEFMPGKQAGMSDACWSDRLIGDLPNLYLYAANNPSEGAIARRRSAATLISYLTPPVTQAGLYRGLLALRESLDRFRALAPNDPEAERLLPLIQAQSVELDLVKESPAWDLSTNAAHEIQSLTVAMSELEATLIPCGLHVVGEPMPAAARAEYLEAIVEGTPIAKIPRASIDAIVAGQPIKKVIAAGKLANDEKITALVTELAQTNKYLSEDHELPALMRALDGKFTRPAPGGDLLRNPAVLPTGRNLHGFDPFAIPSAFAVLDGAEQAARLLARHVADGHALPESVALVLWGADNLKSGGGPIGQALALLGARPRLDSYGRLCGAELIPLEDLGRPRIDVLITLSGIFRDLLPMQTRLLAEAAYLAAAADEPLDRNFVRRHALGHQAKHGCDLETAALRVFSNGDGAYGSNVNQLIDSGAWQDEDELAETFAKRKCFAYGRSGAPVRQEELLKSVLSGVELAYQNLESVELGVTTVDHYFDTLGGIGRAVKREKGDGVSLPVYIGDQTRGGEGKVRTLTEQVSLESRTRSLNPKWAEEMLKHGAEGVRQIEAQVTNTLGWSATTSQVEPWVYRELTQTYVLDPAMRARLAKLNPKASLKLANRLIEATERSYWKPDAEMLAALQAAGEELEDRLEGLSQVA